jgi:DNA-damage-inducible protein J
MSQSTINIRVDGDDKKRFEQFCNDTGMNVSVAINMFIKAVLREHKLPFTIQSDMPNTATIAAIEEGEKLMRDPNAKRFKSVDELFEELDS